METLASSRLTPSEKFPCPPPPCRRRDELKPSVISTRGDTYLSSIQSISPILQGFCYILEHTVSHYPPSYLIHIQIQQTDLHAAQDQGAAWLFCLQNINSITLMLPKIADLMVNHCSRTKNYRSKINFAISYYLSFSHFYPPYLQNQWLKSECLC